MCVLLSVRMNWMEGTLPVWVREPLKLELQAMLTAHSDGGSQGDAA